MLLSQSVKPISYVKAHASELVNSLADGGGTIIVTQNGEAKAVIQSIGEYEKMQESLSLLKIIAISENIVKDGNAQNAEDAFRDIRKEIKQAKQRKFKCPAV